MEFGISTHIYHTRPVTVDLLESLRKAGYSRIELFCSRPHLDFHDRALIRAIGRWFQENALPDPSIHLPFAESVSPAQKVWINPLDPERRHREAAIDEIKRSLELADHVTLAYAVLHLGNPGDEFHPLAYDYAYAVIDQIRKFAGLKVMIENIPNEISTVPRIQEFKAVADVPDIGICYDTGHGYLQSFASGFEHIDATHIHDNDGQKDQHRWPFDGVLDWPALVAKFIRADYKGEFIFEARGENLAKGANARARLEAMWAEARESMQEFRLKYKLQEDQES